MSAPSTTHAQTLAGRLDKLYEFDREPISPDKLQGGRRFARRRVSDCDFDRVVAAPRVAGPERGV